MSIPSRPLNGWSGICIKDPPEVSAAHQLGVRQSFLYSMHIMINIILDKELDKEVFKDFWGFSTEGADFGERGIKRIHPTITESGADEYIDTYYNGHAEKLEDARQELQDALNGTAVEYFDAVSKVFGVSYSDIQYTGSLSIFDCNPRYVDDKKFQVFYKRDLLGKLEVAYHEVLHFAFFEHARRTCLQMVDGFDANGGSYWALSEIFNVIILNRPDFQNILKREEQMFYPMLRHFVDPVRNLYAQHSGDFCEFLRTSISYLDVERVRQI